MKELSADKGKEISAIFNELEEKLKEKDVWEDLAKKQETSILGLEEQLEKRNLLNNTKDTKMNEREEMLKKEIEKLQLDVSFCSFCFVIYFLCLYYNLINYVYKNLSQICQTVFRKKEMWHVNAEHVVCNLINTPYIAFRGYKCLNSFTVERSTNRIPTNDISI